MYAILDNDQKSQLLVLRKFTKSCYNAGNMYVFNSFVVLSFGKTYNFHLASIDIIGFIKYIYFEQIPGMLYVLSSNGNIPSSLVARYKNSRNH